MTPCGLVWPEWQLMLDIWRQPRRLTLPFMKLIRYLNVMVLIFVFVDFVVIAVIVAVDVVVDAVVVVWPVWQSTLDIWRQPRRLTRPFMKLIRYLHVIVLIYVVVDFVVVDVVVVFVVWMEWQLMLDIWRQPRQLTLPFMKLIRYSYIFKI
jgi:hypothetical protein